MADKINYKSVLNASQYEAASTIDGAMLIIAGAGTGKTYTSFSIYDRTWNRTGKHITAYIYK